MTTTDPLLNVALDQLREAMATIDRVKALVADAEDEDGLDAGDIRHALKGNDDG